MSRRTDPESLLYILEPAPSFGFVVPELTDEQIVSLAMRHVGVTRESAVVTHHHVKQVGERTLFLAGRLELLRAGQAEAASYLQETIAGLSPVSAGYQGFANGGDFEMGEMGEPENGNRIAGQPGSFTNDPDEGKKLGRHKGGMSRAIVTGEATDTMPTVEQGGYDATN